MQLSHLLQGLDVDFAKNSVGDVEVSHVALDSRKVREGAIFVALHGASVDGTRFIPQAIDAGAVAVLVHDDADLASAIIPDAVTMLRSPDPRLVLAKAAARIAGRQPEHVAAVTGTSGKTSVAAFTRQILSQCGKQAAALGTVGVTTDKGTDYGSLTTPDPVSLHELLGGLDDEGITHLVMEASSHGLDQRRLDGVCLQAAGFTNLGRDHMDYHTTIDEYFAAKMRLFDALLPQTGTAVIWADTVWGQRAIEHANARGQTVWSVGEQGETVRLLGVREDGFHQHLQIQTPDGDAKVALPLAGRFQVENALVSLGLAVALGSQWLDACKALETLKGAPGRLEPIGTTKDGALCLIDYAHKPDALVAVLKAAREFTQGRLHVVFGAGGDRDAGKRPLMGEAASTHADAIIVTDDNPRSEVPASIRRAILDAAPDALEIGDRAEAIAQAVSTLQAGDVLIVAGKGHETGQEIAGKVYPFSDHDVLCETLLKSGGSVLHAQASDATTHTVET